MAYDQDKNCALLPIELLPQSARDHVTPVGYFLEPELKIKIPVASNKPQLVIPKHPNIKPLDPIQQTADIFYLMACTFHNSAHGQESYIDARYALYRDNVLGNIALDTTVRVNKFIFPEMAIENNGYQLRKRFSASVQRDGLENGSISNFDINAKNKLKGGHRSEFECVMQGTNFIESYRRDFLELNGLPGFFHKIDPQTLFATHGWLTSRATLFVLTRIPNTDIFAECEICFDATKATSPNFDSFVNDELDCEFELEVKAFRGVDNRLLSKEGQIELIDTLFSSVFSSLRKVVPNIYQHEESKKERTQGTVVERLAPHSSMRLVMARNNPFGRLIDNSGACAGLAHTFSLAVSPSNIHDPFYQGRIILCASEMPQSSQLIDNTRLKQYVEDQRNSRFAVA